MINPTNLKKKYQTACYNDTLANVGFSAQICVAVINEMINIKISANEKPKKYPQDMALKYIEQHEKTLNKAMETLRKSPLFSGRYSSHVFQKNELIEENLIRAQVYIDKLELELSQRTVGYWLLKGIQKISTKIKK